MLSKFVASRPDDWDEFLPTCLYAYNTSRHESSSFTPFQLMFARAPFLPIDINMDKMSAEEVVDKWQDAGEMSPSRAQEHITQHHKLVEVAKTKISEAQEKQKKYFDLKHSSPTAYNIGTKVLLKDFTRKKRKGGKLDLKWVGPFRISRNLGKGLYSITPILTGPGESMKSAPKRVHGVHLKVYRTPPSSPNQSLVPFLNDDSETSPSSPLPALEMSSRSNTLALYDHSALASPFLSTEDNAAQLQNGFLQDPLLSIDMSSSSIRGKTPPPSSPLKSLPDVERPIIDIHCFSPSSSHPSTETPPPGPLPSPDIFSASTQNTVEFDASTPEKCGGFFSPFIPEGSDELTPIKRQSQSIMPISHSQCDPLQRLQVCNTNSNTVTAASPGGLNNPIVVSDSPARPTRYWVESLSLKNTDKAQLISGDWLTDNHMRAVGTLLMKQFPQQNGFQDTLILANLLRYEAGLDNFIQIVNVKDLHWVCVSNMFSPSGTVDVFDSIPYFSIGCAGLLDQVASILKTADGSFQLRHIDIQRQTGSSDCGLFAIANSIALCAGEDPCAMNFAQITMRKHLAQCFEQGHLTPFPKASKPRRTASSRRIVNTQTVHVYCLCRLPWNKHDKVRGCMVQCNQCKEWFHAACAKISKKQISTPKFVFHCANCDM